MDSPTYQDRIWVNPSDVNHYLSFRDRKKLFGVRNVDQLFGNVIHGDWGGYKKDYYKKNSYKHCYQRYINGRSWEDTDRFDDKMKQINLRGRVDGCSNLPELRKRYERLDKIFKQIKKEGKLRTQEQLSGIKRYFFKGKGEIEILIDEDGTLIHGCGGNHRIAIAKILSLEQIPAKIGIVHPDGIKYLKQYRKKN